MRARSVLAGAAALSMASCGGPASRQPDASAPVAAQRAAPARAKPAAPPKAAAPVLTPDGLGSLRIGMTLAQVTDAMGPDAEPDAVGGPDPAACDQFRPARAPQGVLVMLEEGRLTRISLIRASTIRTDRGVALGNTSAQVKAAYGPAAVSSLHKYRDPPAEYLTFWSRKAVAGDHPTPTDRGIVFEVDEKGIVDLVHAGGPSIQYVEGCL